MGAPQGTLQASILLILYVNDQLVSIIKDTVLIQYVDR